MILCPSCDNPIPPADINISTDVALCRACNSTIAVSDVVHSSSKPQPVFDTAAPVSGTWFHNDGVEIRIGASTRSSIAFFVVPFAAIWSGFSLGTLYGTQVASGAFNLGFSLIGMPFLIGSVVLWSRALMLVAGKTEVRLRSGEGAIFRGIGSLGRTTRFSTSGITTIREDWSGLRTNRQPRKMIILDGARRITLGALLSEPRRHFLLQSLRSALRINH